MPLPAEGTAAQQLKLTVLAIRTCALPLGESGVAYHCSLPVARTPLLSPSRFFPLLDDSHHPASALLWYVLQVGAP